MLNFYKAYRHWFAPKWPVQHAGRRDSGAARHHLRQYRNYANRRKLQHHSFALHGITTAFPRVGKSHVAMRLVEALGAIRLRSDVERKRLFGEQTVAMSTGGIYSRRRQHQDYSRLHEIAEVILHAGFPVVIDATYLKREQRDNAAKIAKPLAHRS